MKYTAADLFIVVVAIALCPFVLVFYHDILFRFMCYLESSPDSASFSAFALTGLAFAGIGILTFYVIERANSR